MKTLLKNSRLFLLITLMMFQSNVIFSHYSTNYKKLVQEGDIAFKKAEYNKAIKYYYKAYVSIKKFNKKHLPLLYNLGYIQMELKEYKNASNSFSKYIYISNSEISDKNPELTQVAKWKYFCMAKQENEELENSVSENDEIIKAKRGDYVEKENLEFGPIDNTMALENIYFIEEGNDDLEFLSESNMEEFDMGEDDSPADFEESFEIPNEIIFETELPSEPEKSKKSKQEKKTQTNKTSFHGIEIIEANIIPLSEYLAMHNMKVEELNNIETKPLPKPLLSKENCIKLYKSEVGGLIYRVQIGAYAYPIKYYSSEFPNINPNLIVEEKYNLYKYTTGKFSTIQAAKQYKSSLKTKGYHDAFITCYYNGTRISMNEAISTIELSISQN